MYNSLRLKHKTFSGKKIIVMAALLLAFAGLANTSINGGEPNKAILAKDDMPSLRNATGWINSPALKTADLRGKVVLVNFWTYTCINWLRTVPYLRVWAEKYKDQGLVIIGVHTPEFDFEKSIINVQQAVKDMNISYPIATDNDYGIWRDFNNGSWPALYFVDGTGKIRHRQIGEGNYAAAEKIIQQLLMEAGSKDVSKEAGSMDGAGIELAADWENLQSPENYTGYLRTENFVSPGGANIESRGNYSLPAMQYLNEWALSGNWTFKKQAVVLNRSNGRLRYRFRARDLHVVMSPEKPGTHIRFRITINGKPPGAAHGLDVDEAGNGTVILPRLYQLIRQQLPIRESEFEIEFLDAGAALFAFTFG